MKDETAGNGIKKFVRLKPDLYSYLVGDNSEHKQKCCCKRHNEYKYVLLNKKCLRHLLNRIPGKDHRLRTYEIQKISFYYSDNEICI